MLNCPVWTLSSHPGRGYNGCIEINVMNRRICVFDDETYPPNLFPISPAVQDISLHGDGLLRIRFILVRSANINFRMGKMTVSYIEGDRFTSFVSMEDYNIVMNIMRV